MLRTLLLICFCVVSTEANSCASYPIPRPLPQMSGKFLTNQTYLSLSNKPLIQCAVRCMRQRMCASFNYYNQNKTCELNTMTHLTAPGSLTAAQSEDVEYYTIDQWDENWLGKCRNHDCPSEAMCVGKTDCTNGNFICITADTPNSTPSTCEQSNTATPNTSITTSETPKTSTSTTTSSTVTVATASTTTASATLEAITSSKATATTSAKATTETTTSNEGTVTTPTELTSEVTTTQETTTTDGATSTGSCNAGCANCVSGGAVDGRNYVPLGCYSTLSGVSKILPYTLGGTYIDFNIDNSTYYESMVYRCAQLANANFYKYFGLGEHYVCFAADYFTTENFDQVAIGDCGSQCVHSGVGIGVVSVTFAYELDILTG